MKTDEGQIVVNLVCTSPYSIAVGTFLSMTIAGRACQAASNSRTGSYRYHGRSGQACWPWEIQSFGSLVRHRPTFGSVRVDFSLV